MTRTGSEALETTGTGQPAADTQNTQTPAAARTATPARGMPALIHGSRNHGAFDLHRKGGTCNNPASLGLAPVTSRAYECWGSPGEEPS